MQTNVVNARKKQLNIKTRIQRILFKENGKFERLIGGHSNVKKGVGVVDVYYDKKIKTRFTVLKTYVV